jgi:hypothetical protein
MIRLAIGAGALLLLFSADNPQVLPWRTSAPKPPDILSGVTFPLFPETGSSQQGNQSQAPPQNPNSSKDAKPGDAQMQASGELALVRYVDGEYAHCVQPLPGGRQGFVMQAGHPLNKDQLQKSLASHGAVASPGDQVQITGMTIRRSEIVFQINGGGRQKINWRDHLSIGLGGIPSATETGDVPAGPQNGLGATIILDFGKPVPNVTPEELKQYLSPLLNFAAERSAAVQWVETLPPEVKQAIADKKPLVGMSREMVEAAIGKPDKIVRERNADGDETTDWIYGQPPAKTVFVTFVGDKVIKIKQFPTDTIAEQ